MKVVVKRKIVKVLQKFPELDTGQICENVNEISKHGTTSHEVSNILWKCPEFIRIRTESKMGIDGNYEISVWCLAKGVSS